jgi:preprotein translocase subunit SecG
MTAFGLLAVSFIMNVVAVLFVLCCIALILIVLVQKGKGGGLSGAFGGAMSSGILGSKTGDFLTWVTIILAGVFLFLAIIMAKFYKEQVSDYETGQPVQQQTSAGQGQTATVDEEQVAPGMTAEGDASGGSEAGESEIPVTSEQELPADSAAVEAGDTGETSDANLPGN